jgi:hypothetical protein
MRNIFRISEAMQSVFNDAPWYYSVPRKKRIEIWPNYWLVSFTQHDNTLLRKHFWWTPTVAPELDLKLSWKFELLQYAGDPQHLKRYLPIFNTSKKSRSFSVDTLYDNIFVVDTLYSTIVSYLKLYGFLWKIIECISDVGWLNICTQNSSNISLNVSLNTRRQWLKWLHCTANDSFSFCQIV